jgi:hypothetical protein
MLQRRILNTLTVLESYLDEETLKPPSITNNEVNREICVWSGRCVNVWWRGAITQQMALQQLLSLLFVARFSTPRLQHNFVDSSSRLVLLITG